MSSIGVCQDVCQDVCQLAFVNWRLPSVSVSILTEFVLSFSPLPSTHLTGVDPATLLQAQHSVCVPVIRTRAQQWGQQSPWYKGLQKPSIHTKDSQLKHIVYLHVGVQRVVSVNGRMDDRPLDDVETLAQRGVSPVDSERPGKRGRRGGGRKWAQLQRASSEAMKMHELRVLSRGSCDPSIVGQLQSVGQSSIAERHGGSERNGSGHVGNTVVEHAIHNEGRLIVSRRSAGLRACNSACVRQEWRHRHPGRGRVHRARARRISPRCIPPGLQPRPPARTPAS